MHETSHGGSDGTAASGRLIVGFCGEEWVLEPGDELGFGRAADLVVDDNPYLHRRVGRFAHRGGAWWLDNVGRTVAVTVLDRAGSSSATVGPGSSCALVHAAFVLAFAAGPADYEIEGTLEDLERHHDLGGEGAAVAVGGPGAVPPTLDWGRVPLNEDQRDLLLALCTHRLRRPADRFAPLPTNRACAQQLGWSLAKFNRKLDHLCEKLARAGVRGVHGDLGLLAADRRRVLVDHAVQVGLVTAADLGDEAARAS
jgi:hypothetical protein